MCRTGIEHTSLSSSIIIKNYSHLHVMPIFASNICFLSLHLYCDILSSYLLISLRNITQSVAFAIPMASPIFTPSGIV